MSQSCHPHYWIVRFTFTIAGITGREEFGQWAAGHVQAVAVAGVQLGAAICREHLGGLTLSELVGGRDGGVPGVHITNIEAIHLDPVRFPHLYEAAHG